LADGWLESAMAADYTAKKDMRQLVKMVKWVVTENIKRRYEICKTLIKRLTRGVADGID
jgi:hypothetical protein